MEKQMVNLFLLFGFNYLMFKYWGTWKVTLLTVIGNYFFICILIKSYISLPKFIELFNAIFIFGISVIGTYILWRKNKEGTLNDYEKRALFFIRTLDGLLIILVLLLLLLFLFIKYA